MIRIIPYFSSLVVLAVIFNGVLSAPANSDEDMANFLDLFNLDDSQLSTLAETVDEIENIIEVETATPPKTLSQDPQPNTEAVTVTSAPIPKEVPVLTVPAQKPSEEQRVNLVYNAIVNISFNIECPEDLDLCDELMAALDLEQIAFQTDFQSRLEKKWNDILQKQFTATARADDTDQEKPCLKPILEDTAALIIEETASFNLEEIAAPNSVDSLEELDASPPTPSIHNVQWSPSLVQGAQVHVNYMGEYHRMTVSAFEDDPALEKLARVVADHAASAPPMQRTPAVDEIVIGSYDGAYYRGRVTAVEGDLVDMELLEYGGSTKVKSSELMELSSEIIAHPFYGIVMIMADVPVDINTSDILDAEQPANGQIEILSHSTGAITGRLWISEDSSWNDVINDHLLSVGE